MEYCSTADMVALIETVTESKYQRCCKQMGMKGAPSKCIEK